MLTFGPRVDGYYDVEDQMIWHLRRRAEECFRRRYDELSAVATLDDFATYRTGMRERMLQAIGGLPQDKTPLDAQITGRIDRGDFVVDKVLFHSLPNFPVTASLYLPKSRIDAEPGPAVLFVCGHAEEAKAHPGYQKVCIDLALDGFVVLAIDPPGQGERFQFIDEKTGYQRIKWGTTEHTYSGMQYYAAGMSIARHFVWDGIRAIDYLESRPEVDNEKIGVTGNSGGGVQSAFLMMTEPRLAAAMPCTFIMDYENYMKTGQPQDGEQNLPGSFSDGPGHDDYLTAMAPKPVRMGLAAYDFFPIEGALATYERAKKIYDLFDAADKLDYAVAPTTHTYGPYLRQCAVNFFRKYLRGDEESFITADPEPLPIAELNVTATGQVLTAIPGVKTISELCRAEMQERLPLSPRKADPAELRTQLAGALGLTANAQGHAAWQGPAREREIFPRVIVDREEGGYRTEKIFFFTEPDVVVTAIMIHPRDERKAEGTEILLLPEGTNDIPEQRARIVGLLENQRNVCVLDVRGTGAVKVRGQGRTATIHATEFKLGCDAMKMNLSTLGLRVFDVLRTVDYLYTRGDRGALSLTAFGPPGAWGLYAAALDERIESLTLESTQLSYRAAAETRYYERTNLDFKTTAYGLLTVGDTVDFLAALAPRPVTFVSPLGPEGRPISSDRIDAEFLTPAKAVGLVGPKAGDWQPAFLGV